MKRTAGGARRRRSTDDRAGLLGPRAILAVVLRPRLWRPLATLVPPRWWSRPPYLPLPPRDYLRFRSETMYGDPAKPAGREDLIAYLDWCRRSRYRAR